MNPLTREQMRAVDRAAIEEFGIPGVVLMENAGRGAADVACEMLADAADPRVVIACGGGNNGGDGFVIARHLHNRHIGVSVRLLAPPEKCGGDAATHLSVIRKMGIDVATASPDELALGDAELVVDALLGTGLSGEVRSPFDAAIEATNAAGRSVLSVDLPSGLDANTGEILGCCVRATRTVTFAAPKLGFKLRRGPEMTGPLTVVDIGVPRELLE
jgi:NAD(P)H-hydrate epimerase